MEACNSAFLARTRLSSPSRRGLAFHSVSPNEHGRFRVYKRIGAVQHGRRLRIPVLKRYAASG